MIISNLMVKYNTHFNISYNYNRESEKYFSLLKFQRYK